MNESKEIILGEKSYYLSKIPNEAAITLAFPFSNIINSADSLRSDIALELMRYVSLKKGDEFIALDSETKINKYVNSWLEVEKLAWEVARYNQKTIGRAVRSLELLAVDEVH